MLRIYLNFGRLQESGSWSLRKIMILHKQGTLQQSLTDLGAGGGGRGEVATNLLLSEGLSATFLLSAKFLP